MNATSTDMTGPYRVLVVEDDVKLANLLHRALRDDGINSEIAYDGLSAIDLLMSEPFTAVVLDVGLPGLSGLCVCARLRAAGLSLPVLMLSARDGIDDVQAGRRAGATDYLLKPFSLRELTTRLRDLGTAESSHRHLIGVT